MQKNFPFLLQRFNARSEQVSKSLCEIGTTLFQLLLKQICLFQINDQKVYQQSKQKIFHIIHQKISSSKQANQSKHFLKRSETQHFYQNLGCLFIDRNFQVIQGVKKQIKFFVEMSMFQAINKNSFAQQNLLYKPYQSDMSNTKANVKKIQLQNDCQINSTKTQNNICSKAATLIKQIKMLHIKQNDIVKMKVRQCSSQLQLKVFIFRQDKFAQISHNVDHYLTNIHNYRNELNYFCLMMKITNAIFNTYKLDPFSHVSFTQLKFKCKCLAYSMVSFKGEGKDRYLKGAQNKAALMILRSIYKEIPQLWQQFVIMKQKKQIIT